MIEQAIALNQQKTLEMRKTFLDSIELNESIKGFSATKCTTCTNAAFQSKCGYEGHDYFIPSERMTAKQKNSSYWLICFATGKLQQIGEVSECEMYEELSAASKLGALACSAKWTVS